MMRMPLVAALLLLATPVLAQSGAPAPAASAPSTSRPTAVRPAPAQPMAPRHRRTQQERFDDANTTHDGKLTLEQARAGRMNAVVRDFAEIDTARRGYVTFDEIKAHRRAVRAAKRAARAN